MTTGKGAVSERKGKKGLRFERDCQDTLEKNGAESLTGGLPGQKEAWLTGGRTPQLMTKGHANRGKGETGCRSRAEAIKGQKAQEGRKKGKSHQPNQGGEERIAQLGDGSLGEG